jgi:hypothetical protein
MHRYIAHLPLPHMPDTGKERVSPFHLRLHGLEVSPTSPTKTYGHQLLNIRQSEGLED